MSEHRYFIELITKHNEKFYINSRNQQVPTTVLATTFETKDKAISKYNSLMKAKKLKAHESVNYKPTINLQGTG